VQRPDTRYLDFYQSPSPKNLGEGHPKTARVAMLHWRDKVMAEGGKAWRALEPGQQAARDHGGMDGRTAVGGRSRFARQGRSFDPSNDELEAQTFPATRR